LANATVLDDISASIEAAHVRPKFVYGDFFRKDAEGRLQRVAAKPIQRLPLGLPASHQTMYFENERLRQLEFRLEYKLSADYCLLIEFLQGYDSESAVMQLQFPLCIFD